MDSTFALFDFTSVSFQTSQPDNFLHSRLEEEKALYARLEQAAATGDTKTLTEVFRHSQNLGQASDAILKRPGNALYLSVKNGQYESTECLLQHRVCITTNAVKMAVRRQDTKMFDLLLRNGWDINMQLALTIPSALALAIQDAHLATWLLQHGASPNAKCALDLTPLSYAIQEGLFSIVQMLFEHGGGIQHGQLLHYAVFRTLPDYLDVLELVLSKNPSVNHIMYQEDHKSYNQQRAFALGTPLHEAAELGRLDVVQILVAKGANLLIKDSCGDIPLQRAERGRYTSVIEYLTPLTAKATCPEVQFTEGREATVWG